ncbi:MAG: VOC family protein [Myxococcales bacterium]|nr:VOC family protein [Myxococcales bacterium]MCB9519811.1 VOC family protein [Myxococcales bacterium]
MLHHVEIYVSDLPRTVAFWTPLLERLGYAPDPWPGGMTYRHVAADGAPTEGAYLCFLPAEPEHAAAGYHRKRVGLNHLAFHGRSREHVDELRAWLRAEGRTLLYDDRYPFAGGPDYYAVFFEDPDRIKVEVAAPPAD